MTNPIDSPLEEFNGQSAGTVTIAAPGVGRRNWLADLTVKSDAGCTLAVTSGGATIFSVDLAANEGFEKSWARGLRGAENASMVITVSAGTYSINYSGTVA